MQACKIITAISVLAALCGAFGQGSTSAPSMPVSPSMPEMPSVSIPTFSDTFYSPGFNTTKTKKNTQSTAEAVTTEKKRAENTLSDSSKSNIPLSLSATDISSLGNMGLLSHLTSTSDAGTSSTTTALLQQILSELADLKKQVAETQAALKSQKIITTAEDSSSQGTVQTENVAPSIDEKQENLVPKSAASLLRFTVNGYSLISTCRTVYVSEKQADGSFLVTGDRRYISNGTFFTETFYLLFRPSGAKNGTETYTVAASVSQTTPNPYSYVYRLSERQGLSASRTGNLVALIDSGDRWNVDLLLDIGE